jgi:Flp pilus assembly pilin Flp
MSIFKHLSIRAKRLWADESGSIAVESVLMVPLMAWAILATLTYFDAYRNEAISHKAGLTIADMISREADTIDQDYINGSRDLLRFLTIDDANPDLRITSFRWNESQDKYQVVWSREKGPRRSLKTPDLVDLKHRLPLMANGERAILVETWTDYEPPWNVGIDPLSMDTFMVISPRFVTQLCFSTTPNDVSSLKC